MKKSLLALAVTAGIAASGAASAEVKTYGHAQVEIGFHGGDTAVGTSVDDNARGRIGFKASEDLGNGLKAIVKAEYKTDFADGDSSGVASLTKREMLVGLKGGFGQVELGRLKQAYKYYGGVKYDPFVATLLQARGNGGMTSGAFGHNSFLSDSIGYQNKVGAISFRITYDFDNGGPGADTGTQPMTAGVKFTTKQFEAGFAMVDDDNTYDSTKIFGKYKIAKNMKINAQMETASNADVIWVNFDMGLGGGLGLNAAFGTLDHDTNANDKDMLRVAVTKKFSKQTKAWAGYRSTDTNGSADNVIAVGMQKRF